MTTEDVIAAKSRTGPMVYYLPVFAGLGLACALFAIRSGQSSVERYWVLASVAVLLWLKPCHQTLATLQIVVGLLLCCVPVAQASQCRFALIAFEHRLSVSAGIGVFVLLLCAYITKGSGRVCKEFGKVEHASCMSVAWCVGYGILVTHMMFLGLLLTRTYGYGYERSIVVLGRTGLLALACLSFPRALANLSARRIMSGMLLITFLLATLTQWLAVR